MYKRLKALNITCIILFGVSIILSIILMLFGSPAQKVSGLCYLIYDTLMLVWNVEMYIEREERRKLYGDHNEQ